MKLKPKGRKIYRQKTRFERIRDFLDNTGAVAGMVILLTVMLFIGISAGPPIMQFLENRNFVTQGSEPSEMMTEAETRPQETEISTDPETTADPEPVETETLAPSPQAGREMHGYVLECEDLMGEESLQAAMEKLPGDTTHVIVPLKANGGNLYYASCLPEATASGAVKAAMSLEKIRLIIEADGKIAAAYLNLLEDTVFPQISPQAGFSIAETGEPWLDDSLENGGMPWVSPFSMLTRNYLSEITGEISDAGYQVFVCGGLRFPEFSEHDLELLPEEVNARDRYTVLSETVEAIRKAALSSQVYIQMNGAEVLDGTSEILQASPFAAGYILTVTPGELSDRYAFTEKIPDGIPCILQLEGKGSGSQIEIDGNYVLHPAGSPEILTSGSNAQEETDTQQDTNA